MTHHIASEKFTRNLDALSVWYSPQLLGTLLSPINTANMKSKLRQHFISQAIREN